MKTLSWRNLRLGKKSLVTMLISVFFTVGFLSLIWQYKSPVSIKVLDAYNLSNHVVFEISFDNRTDKRILLMQANSYREIMESHLISCKLFLDTNFQPSIMMPKDGDIVNPEDSLSIRFIQIPPLTKNHLKILVAKKGVSGKSLTGSLVPKKGDCKLVFLCDHQGYTSLGARIWWHMGNNATLSRFRTWFLKKAPSTASFLFSDKSKVRTVSVDNWINFDASKLKGEVILRRQFEK